MVNEYGYSQYHLQEFLWWNRNVRLKHRNYFYYPIWYAKGIQSISQLHDGFGNAKLFEDLVIEFDIPFRDHRKYDSLMNGISLSWFDDSLHINDDIFMMIVNN